MEKIEISYPSGIEPKPPEQNTIVLPAELQGQMGDSLG